jgi:diguanylate cyclase (GGDEF)-like protein
MYSLYDVLTKQHRDEFAPLRCSEQTILRLFRYFEDVVTENKLSAFAIEGRCLDGVPGREMARLNRLLNEARHLYLFSCDASCATRKWQSNSDPKLTSLEEKDHHKLEPGPFVLVMDPRFCGLLASRALTGEGASHSTTYEMIWTFDPNVVFTAIQYLMARVAVQKQDELPQFEALLNSTTAHSPSLRLALTLTTKLTMLMQRQTELEMATNRISSAVSSTLDLDSILQSAVDEVGRALKAHRAAIVLWQDGTSTPEGMSIYERPEPGAQTEGRARIYHDSPPDNTPGTVASEQARSSGPGPLKVPITYRNSIIGELVVEDNTPSRIWEDEEILMTKTASDQLAVAVSHARLFRQVETQAMTDELTGLYNLRYFQDRLEREIRFADRNNQSVSLILLDLDRLKLINDAHGHQTGDAALQHVASVMQTAIRDVDVCARYGGEEFVVILPQCALEDAKNVADRVREAIASKPLGKVGQLTASFGVATYPTTARTREELIELADRAMYLAKAEGRNRVRTPIQYRLTENRPPLPSQ